MRPLSLSDYSKGHLETLKSLTSVGEIGPKEWEERWRWMKRRNDDPGPGGAVEGKQGAEGKGGEYFVIVVCDGEGKIVGTGTVVAERKL